MGLIAPVAKVVIDTSTIQHPVEEPKLVTIQLEKRREDVISEEQPNILDFPCMRSKYRTYN